MLLLCTKLCLTESDILKDEEQMRNISEAIQKLQDIETNRGEDHIYTEEAADRIHSQGNVELVEPRQTSKTVHCEGCLRHSPEGMVRWYCGYIIRLPTIVEDTDGPSNG